MMCVCRYTYPNIKSSYTLASIDNYYNIYDSSCRNYAHIMATYVKCSLCLRATDSSKITEIEELTYNLRWLQGLKNFCMKAKMIMKGKISLIQPCSVGCIAFRPKQFQCLH